GLELSQGAAPVEQLQLTTLALELLTQRSSTLLIHGVSLNNHSVTAGTFEGNQPLAYIPQDQRRVACQRVAPAAATPGIEQQQITCPDLDVVALGRQYLAAAIGTDQLLATALPGCPTVHAPGVGQPAVIVDGNLPVDQQPIGHSQAVTAPVQPGAAGVGQGFIGFNAQREVGFDKLVRHVGKAWPQGVAVRPITHRSPGNTTEADLEQLEPLAFAVIPGIHEVR